jgi:hypothetical protein
LIKNKFNRRKFIKSSALTAISAFFLPSIITDKNIFYNKKHNKGEIKKMAYEWKFNPRPYTDEEAKTLLKDVVSPETSDWHYNTHHKGYVTFLNNI